MKLWLISQTENNDYDTYDSAVVAAETATAARRIHPGGREKYSEEHHSWGTKHGEKWWPDTTWASRLGHVSVTLIGDALPSTEAGVICASFNAG